MLSPAPADALCTAQFLTKTCRTPRRGRRAQALQSTGQEPRPASRLE